MLPQGRGRTVHIASQLAAVAMHDRAIYAITKAGLAHLCKAFAVELAPMGWRSMRWGPLCVDASPPACLTTGVHRRESASYPGRRFGTTDDVLGAVTIWYLTLRLW